MMKVKNEKVWCVSRSWIDENIEYRK